MVDRVIQAKNRIVREFCSFYTESDHILEYMVRKLKVADDDKILEPCAGDGVFIDKIISTIPNEVRFSIDAFDLNSKATDKLNLKYSDIDSIKVKNTDTLLDMDLDFFSTMGGFYDKVIGNPPYGAWQDSSKRHDLKKRYGGYVRETYALFLKRCINLLKGNGRLVFIIPDTFLALHLHKELRKFLLDNTTLEEILLIPSKFFPGVNFGYSNLCIITLSNVRPQPDTSFKLVKVSKSIEILYELAKGDYSNADKNDSVKQSQIKENVDYSFFLNGSTKINNLVNNGSTKLGDLADCVTGFYSGDNKQFLATTDKRYSEKSSIALINSDLIEFTPSTLEGLDAPKEYIPIYKGGRAVVDKPLDTFVKWSRDIVNHYKKDKKARFQNASYYFKQGIGVPMVKSSRISAFRIDKQVFDQSVVGIFPKDNKHYNLLLTFLNSEISSKILNSINHTANNSSNYLKKIPILYTEKTIKEANKIVKQFDQSKNVEDFLIQTNKLYAETYQGQI